MKFNDRYKDAHLSKVDLPKETLDKINKWLIKPKNFFIFSGNPGLGKTYLAWAIYWAQKEKHSKNRQFSIRIMDEREYYAELRKVFELDWDYNLEIERLCECDFMIIDDILLNYDKDWYREIMFALIDNRYSSQKPTILTTNLTINEIEEKLGTRTTSRLRAKENLLIELDWIDKRQE